MIEALSLPALRTMDGKHANQLVGLSFDQPMQFDNSEVISEDRVIANISSQVWSPRFRKHLALAMVKRDYLASHSEVEINCQQGRITDLPFTNSATG